MSFEPKIKSKDDVMRKCILTQQILPKDELIRFVLSPDNIVVPDLKHKLPGRGSWVENRKEAVEEAISKGLFNRSFKQKVTPIDEMTALIDQLMESQVHDAITICRKTGDLQMGHLKSEEVILSGKTRIYVVANDAGADTRKKLTAKLRNIAEKKGKNCYIVDHFSAATLAKILGQEKVIHVAIKSGTMANNIINKLKQWDKYNGNENRIMIIGELTHKKVAF